MAGSIDSGGLQTAGFAYQYFPRSVEADRSQTSGVVRSAPVEASEPSSPTPLPSKKAESVAKKADAVAKKDDAAGPAAGASASATPASATPALKAGSLRA